MSEGQADMAEEIAARVRRYVLDGNDEDLRRLMGVSEIAADMARAAFRRIGVQEGWSAIDCGCGPIGALAVLAEAVGPTGRVVGVDFNAAAVQRARTLAAALELGNVDVFAGDLHEFDVSAAGGPFDLAYTRLFLMHQLDPRRTLHHIFDLLRPGGWLVAQEALPVPPPRSHPHLEALTEYWDLIHEAIGRVGVPRGVVEDLPRFARLAGFEVAGVSGSFAVTAPRVGFDLHAATAAAIRERATSMGLSGEKVDALAQEIRAAQDRGFEWVSSPFFLDLALRKPG